MGMTCGQSSVGSIIMEDGKSISWDDTDNEEEEDEIEGEFWDEEDGYLVIKHDNGGSEKLSRVDIAVTTTCTTLAETVDKVVSLYSLQLLF